MSRVRKLGDSKLHIVLVGTDVDGNPMPVFDLPEGSSVNNLFNEAVQTGDLTGKAGEIVSRANLFVLFVGMGSIDDIGPDSFRTAAGNACGWVRTHKKVTRDTAFVFCPIDERWANVPQLLAEGWVLRNHSVKRSAKGGKAETDAGAFAVVHVFPHTARGNGTDYGANAAIERGIRIGTLGHWVRRVGNLRGSEGTPLRLATEIRDLIKDLPGVSFPCGEILDTAFYEGGPDHPHNKLRFGAFLSVANGARNLPYGVFARFDCGRPNAKTIAVVGKGVTYDTGGLNLKPGTHMNDMYLDEQGAVIAAATFVEIVNSNPGCHVILMCNCTENDFGTRPSDIITTRGGDEIEVNNTDAEGRLTLGDGIDFCVEQGADHIVDLATLTGAAVAALGGRVAVFSSAGSVHDEIVGLSDLMQLVSFTRDAGIGFWPMPMPRIQAELMASKEADGVNTDLSRVYGCGTAALFLLNALDVANKRCGTCTTLWHMDIAGMMKVEKPGGYRLFGADPGAFLGLAWALPPMLVAGGRFAPVETEV